MIKVSQTIFPMDFAFHELDLCKEVLNFDVIFGTNFKGPRMPSEKLSDIENEF